MAVGVASVEERSLPRVLAYMQKIRQVEKNLLSHPLLCFSSMLLLFPSF